MLRYFRSTASALVSKNKKNGKNGESKIKILLRVLGKMYVVFPETKELIYQ